jgi:hypothetical protein
VLTTARVKRLADLTADRVDEYMGALTCATGTKRVHLKAVNVFAVCASSRSDCRATRSSAWLDRLAGRLCGSDERRPRTNSNG